MITIKNSSKVKKKYVKTRKNKNQRFIKIIIVFILLIIIIIDNIINIPTNITNNNNQKNNNTTINGRIFLCTTYNNEAEMAYIHLWRLYDYVFKFIIVISNLTYSGKPKNISFKPFESNILPFMDKVDIANFNNVCNRKEYPSYNLIWCIERSQRDYAKIYIEKKYNMTENDFLISVDFDEILTREGIEYIKSHLPKDFKLIKGNLYFPYYYHKIIDWNRGFIVRYNQNMKTLSYYRDIKSHDYNTIKYESNPSKPLITHCSYCFKSIEEYKNKLISFAHQEFNKKPFITNNWIFKSHFCREKINPHNGTDEPYEGWQNLIPDDERLKYLIDRSFMYDINKTTYSEKDLETLCEHKFNRTPFELSAKYIYK